MKYNIVFIILIVSSSPATSVTSLCVMRSISLNRVASLVCYQWESSDVRIPYVGFRKNILAYLGQRQVGS